MFLRAKRFCILLGGLLLGGCSGPQFLDLLIPTSGYVSHKHIRYGEHPRQILDIYTPENALASAPVIVFFYGGSWKKGSKEDYRFVGQAFASKGYVVVIADYRLYPEVFFPDFLQDAAKAVAWTHAHIDEYGGDRRNIFLAGHSAGAYNAVMLTVNGTYLAAEGGKRDWIRGTIGLAGPYDFLPLTDPDLIAIFSKAQDADTQPVSYVGAHVPPMLLLTGEADQEVLPRNSIILDQKLRRYHNEVTTHLYPDVAHIGIILALAHGFRDKAPVLAEISTFVDRYRRE